VALSFGFAERIAKLSGGSKRHRGGHDVKKGYWIVAYRSIADNEAFKEYGKVAGPAITAAGGKTLVRTSDAIEPHESGLMQRVVVIEFESFEKATATYKSEAYKKALAVLGTAADRDFRIVEGVD
jgi:uncharacterized protein (DUF1330 family)